MRDRYFDGMIITGAPVEKMEFEEVEYWEELCEIMEWSKTHVTSTFHICWGAQAGLYHHFGINKELLNAKLFGVFEHKVSNRKIPLVRGFDDYFYAGILAMDPRFMWQHVFGVIVLSLKTGRNEEIISKKSFLIYALSKYDSVDLDDLDF